jgi:hypothetical protein
VERPHDGIGFNPCLTDEPRHIPGALNYINKDEERPTKNLVNEMNEREGVQHQEAEAASINYDCITCELERMAEVLQCLVMPDFLTDFESFKGSCRLCTVCWFGCPPTAACASSCLVHQPVNANLGF